MRAGVDYSLSIEVTGGRVLPGLAWYHLTETGERPQSSRLQPGQPGQSVSQSILRTIFHKITIIQLLTEILIIYNIKYLLTFSREKAGNM